MLESEALSLHPVPSGRVTWLRLNTVCLIMTWRQNTHVAAYIGLYA